MEKNYAESKGLDFQRQMKMDALFGLSEQHLGWGVVTCSKTQVLLCDEGSQKSHDPRHGTVRFARTWASTCVLPWTEQIPLGAADPVRQVFCRDFLVYPNYQLS